MIKAIDVDYYTRRIAQERARAEDAANPAARRVHVELATRYAQMIGPQPVA